MRESFNKQRELSIAFLLLSHAKIPANSFDSLQTHSMIFTEYQVIIMIMAGYEILLFLNWSAGASNHGKSFCFTLNQVNFTLFRC